MSLFSAIEPVRFGGSDSTNEFAYRVYDRDQVVLNKRMEDWLKVAVCYWHSFNWPGADIFGAGTLPRPWLGTSITPASKPRPSRAVSLSLRRCSAMSGASSMLPLISLRDWECPISRFMMWMRWLRPVQYVSTKRICGA